MKKLNQFLSFEVEKFLDGKKLKYLGKSDWKDFDTDKTLGTKFETVIIDDQTPYNCKEGEVVSNLYEKINLKCKKDINLHVGSIVKPINPVGTVYGEYRNQLSVTCDDIIVEDNGLVKKGTTS